MAHPRVEAVAGEARAAIGRAASSSELESLRVKYLGRSGALTQILKSLGEDGRWHEAWSGKLLSLVVESEPANAPALASSLERFRWPALDATASLLGAISDLLQDGGALCAVQDDLKLALERRISALNAGLGTGGASLGSSA